jgi:hypothetical protein
LYIFSIAALVQALLHVISDMVGRARAGGAGLDEGQWGQVKL